MREFTLRKLIVATFLVFSVQCVMAQADVDSPYSMFGIGQVRNKTMNTRLGGMGGVANALWNGSMINAENPASYATFDSLAFLFDVGLYAKSSTFSTTQLSEKSSNASLNYVALGFGVTPWWKTAFGAQPYSSVGYNIVVNHHDDMIGNYGTAFRGNGGLNQTFWGNAFRLGKHFSVGANATFVFGDSESLTTLYFPDSTYRLATRRGVDLMVRSFMFDYGMLYRTELGDNMNLSLGLTYNQKIKIGGRQTTFIRTIIGNAGLNEVEHVVDTIFYKKQADGSLTLPHGVGFGVALQKNNRWTVGADFNWSQWKGFERNGIADTTLQNAWSVACGAEYLPVSSAISNYWSRVSYRFGGFYEQTSLRINGQSINKFGVTMGMSLPLARSLSKVHLGLEFGQCGTKSDRLIQERYINFTVGVSVHERWFMKRRYQ